MAATQFSADTPLLATGLIATAGTFALWRLWIYALAFLLLGFVLAPCWRRAGVLTDAELAQRRYGSRYAGPLRVIKALYFGLVFNCAVLAMVLFAAARITEPFLPWHAWLPAGLYGLAESLVATVNVSLSVTDPPGSVVHSTDNLISLVSILALTAAYSTTGGLRAVVRTDVLQLCLALGGSLLYAIHAVGSAGGLAGLRGNLTRVLDATGSALDVDALLAFEPSRAQDASLPVLAVLGLQWLLQMNADGTGYLAQRCMACRSDADATRATLVFTVTQVLLRSLLWLPIGLALLVVLPPEPGLSHAALAADRERSFVLGMQLLLPPAPICHTCWLPGSVK
jgi:Na+/proline symporter